MAEREEYFSAFSGTQIDTAVGNIYSGNVVDQLSRDSIQSLTDTVNGLSAESLGAVPQYSDMPTAGAQLLGRIIQYVGTSTSGYVHGYFYICVQSGQSFAWENIVVQRDITVDDAMSDSSTNPVQNMVVKGAIDTAVGNLSTSINNSKGAASGLATLDTNIKVTPSQASAKIVRLIGDTTLALEHDGAFLYVDSANDAVITIPADTSVAFPLGAEIEVCQWNTGSVTFAGATGVEIHSVGGIKQIADRYAAVGLKQIAVNHWLLNGALA